MHTRTQPNTSRSNPRRGVLNQHHAEHRIVKCSTHERHRPTFATEMTSAPHDKACVLSAP
ncbi:hypothetical protein ACFPRL_11145 [Pseudoclavibacter helvolus]